MEHNISLISTLAGVMGGAPADHHGVAEETKPLWQAITFTLLQLAAFIALMLVAGRRVLP